MKGDEMNEQRTADGDCPAHDTRCKPGYCAVASGEARWPRGFPAVPGAGIGWAVKQMQDGQRVCRAGWNGKGMYLAYQPGYPDGIAINANTAKATGQPEGTVLKFLPYVMMRTAQGEFVPWLCSQTDLLAIDWQIAGG